MISGYDKDKTGKQTVTVSYEGFTKEFEVNVIKKTILNVELSSLPNKVNYVVNQEFDVSGASLKVIYNNNEVNYVDVTSEMFINPDMSNIGSQEIKLSYEGFELKFSILVKDKVLIDMKLDTSPNVLTYIEGDTLDTNGGKILLVYDNGTEEIVDLEAVMCSVDMNNIGKQTVTIKFNDFKASYDIIINKKQLEYINWITEPSKSIYIEGEEIDYSGKVLLTYNNGIKQEVEVTKDLFMIKNYDSKDIGKQTIYFVYKDTNIKIPYNIEVISKKPIKLEIKQLPYKIDYLKDEAFEIQGLEVIVTYNDETTELISLDDLNVSHINMKKVGKQIITLSYGGVETTFEIKISEKRVEDIKTDNSDDTNLSTDDIPTKEKDRTVSNDTVKTNDNEPFDVYLFVMFTSLFGIILTLKKKIHRKNRIRN